MVVVLAEQFHDTAVNVSLNTSSSVSPSREEIWAMAKAAKQKFVKMSTAYRMQVCVSVYL